MTSTDKPLVWLHGEVKSPPFSGAARLEAGLLLRRLQRGEIIETRNCGAGGDGPHAQGMLRLAYGGRAHR